MHLLLQRCIAPPEHAEHRRAIIAALDTLGDVLVKFEEILTQSPLKDFTPSTYAILEQQFLPLCLTVENRLAAEQTCLEAIEGKLSV